MASGNRTASSFDQQALCRVQQALCRAENIPPDNWAQDVSPLKDTESLV